MKDQAERTLLYKITESELRFILSERRSEAKSTVESIKVLLMGGALFGGIFIAMEGGYLLTVFGALLAFGAGFLLFRRYRKNRKEIDVQAEIELKDNQVFSRQELTK